MPQAISRALREQIVERRGRGETVGQVAQAEGVSKRSVRRIYSAWQQDKERALLTRYRESANTVIQYSTRLYRQAVAMKRKHPSWGAGLIRVQLVHCAGNRRQESDKVGL